jgi:hypothetical protein
VILCTLILPPAKRLGKILRPGFAGRMTPTERGLVLGARTLLAKLDDNALPFEAEQERIWTLLSVAYVSEAPLAVLGSLRRVAKHWQGGDKCLAAIHLAQMGLPDIGEDAAYPTACRWRRADRRGRRARLACAGAGAESGSVWRKQVRRESAARARW